MACAASCACAPITENPAAIAAYGPLTDEAGTRRFAITLKGGDIAAIEGVADRDAAQRLTGTRLYVERDRLPPPDEDEFYLADLVGLDAVTPEGGPLGAHPRGRGPWRRRLPHHRGRRARAFCCPSPAPWCRWWTSPAAR